MTLPITTPVKITPSPSITHHSRLLVIGSCFAQNIGRYLADGKFNIVINPNGITYNPLSIAAILQRLIDGHPYTASDLEFHNGEWVSFMHHGSFNHADRQSALDIINNAYTTARNQLLNATHLVITYGSSVIYERNGAVVNNCHKLPSLQFAERQLSVSEITERHTSLIQHLYDINPTLQIILTVSPVRYLGRGAHAGQINKATLLLAIDSIISQYPEVQYFPSYEIMMDELRDYRYYADDMIHPSPLAVRYIWERFAETHLTADTRTILAEIDEINRSLAHRPLHPDSPEYTRFRDNLTRKIKTLQSKYPDIKF